MFPTSRIFQPKTIIFFNTGSILMFIIASLYKFPSIHTYTKRSVQRWVILEEEDHDHASAWLRKELSQKTRTELECIRHHTSASSHIGYRDCQPALLVLPMLLLKRLCSPIYSQQSKPLLRRKEQRRKSLTVESIYLSSFLETPLLAGSLSGSGLVYYAAALFRIKMHSFIH